MNTTAYTLCWHIPDPALSLVADSNDGDRRIYLALRALFSTAQQCEDEFKPLGWRLYMTSTNENLMVTEYENESYGGMRVRMTSTKNPEHHRVTLFTGVTP